MVVLLESQKETEADLGERLHAPCQTAQRLAFTASISAA